MPSHDPEGEPRQRPDQIEELDVSTAARGRERSRAKRDDQIALGFSMLAMSVFFVGGVLLSIANNSHLSDLGNWIMAVSGVGFVIQFLRAGAPRR